MELLKIIAFLTTLLLINTVNRQVEAKTFTQCQLAKELARSGISRSFLSNWICLVDAESGRSTTKMLRLPNASANYGIFQINSKLWCREGRKGGLCNAKCEDFLNDDITDDITCAKQVHNRDGFKSWKGWMSKCLSRKLPDVSRC